MNVAGMKRDHVSKQRKTTYKKPECARLSYDQVFIVELLIEWGLQGSGDSKYKLKFSCANLQH